MIASLMKFMLVLWKIIICIMIFIWIIVLRAVLNVSTHSDQKLLNRVMWSYFWYFSTLFLFILSLKFLIPIIINSIRSWRWNVRHFYLRDQWWCIWSQSYQWWYFTRRWRFWWGEDDDVFIELQHVGHKNYIHTDQPKRRKYKMKSK